MPEVILFEPDRRDGVRLHEEIVPTLQSFMGTGGGNVPLVCLIESQADND